MEIKSGDLHILTIDDPFLNTVQRNFEFTDGVSCAGPSSISQKGE